MKKQEFRVRDKKVQKMTRDGLVEQNVTQGTQQRVSSRLSDVSFERGKSEDTRFAIQKEGRVQKRTYQQAANVQSDTEIQNDRFPKQEETVWFIDTVIPEAWKLQNMPVSMKDAGDRPMLSRCSSDGNSSLLEQEKKHRQKQKKAVGVEVQSKSEQRKKFFPIREYKPLEFGLEDTQNTAEKDCVVMKKQSIKFASNNEKLGIEKQEKLEENKEFSLVFKQEPLQFEQEDTKDMLEKDHTIIKKKQVEKSVDGVKLEMEAQSKPDGNKVVSIVQSHGKLCFEADGMEETKEKDYMIRKKVQIEDYVKSETEVKPKIGRKKKFSAHFNHGWMCSEQEDSKKVERKDHITIKKKQTTKFAIDGIKPKAKAQIEWDGKEKWYGQLQFELETTKETTKKDHVAVKKKQAIAFAIDDAKSGIEAHLKSDRKKECSTVTKHTSYLHDKDQEISKKKGVIDTRLFAEKEEIEKSKQQKKYEKVQKRVEKASERLEKAKEKLPKQYSNKSKKRKHHLHFETEKIPENEIPSIPKKRVKTIGQAVTTAAARKVHQKVRETERNNVGVEAAHKMEFATERSVGYFLRQNKCRLHEKPYREVHRAESRLAKAHADMVYQKRLKDNPDLQKKAFTKWIQKQKLKQKYAAAARETAKNTQYTTNVRTATGQVVRALVQNVGVRKTVLGIVAVGMLFLSFFGSLFSSCSAMLTGIQSALISTCYVAEDTEINASELKYTELETDLQIQIHHTETEYPGYDEYWYFIEEIGHSPYELMGYLSAVYDDFTYAQVRTELSQLFELQYQLIREEVVEIRTYIDEEGEEQEYEWYILKTILSVRPLSEIIMASLPSGDPTDRYSVYMQTFGNRQCYGNPFEFSWISYVTSPYGYRVHPISGEKNLHRGIDIGVAEGTPIQAVQDGYVILASDAGAYGLCVVIEGEDGYQSRYAHCSSLFVSTGQEVKLGDVIAAVGSTGNSTGAHLHLEITHHGEYLNPYYYVDSGVGEP